MKKLLLFSYMKLKSFLFRDYILSNVSNNVKEDHIDDYPKVNLEEIHDKDNELKEILDFDNHSNLALYKCYLTKGGYYIVGIYGGLNGHGKWSNYLDDIKHIVKEIKDC